MSREDLKELSKKWRKNYNEKKFGTKPKSQRLVAGERLQGQLEIIEAIKSGNFVIEEEDE